MAVLGGVNGLTRIGAHGRNPTDPPGAATAERPLPASAGMVKGSLLVDADARQDPGRHPRGLRDPRVKNLAKARAFPCSTLA